MRALEAARAAATSAVGDPPNIEQLGGALDIKNTALSPAEQDGVWLRHQFIGECAETIESLAISLREAAWRGSHVTVEVTLRQMRETLKTAIVTFKELSAAPNMRGQQ